MKALIFLFVNFSLSNLFAFGILDSSKTDRSLDSLRMQLQSEVTPREKTLLRLQLLTNSFNINNLSFQSDSALRQLVKPDENLSLSPSNILDDYLLKRIYARNKTEDDIIANCSALRSEQLLEALNKNRHHDSSGIATVRKYLGVSKETVGYILLLIHLLKF